MNMCLPLLILQRQKAEGTSKSSGGADEEARASITSTSLTDGVSTHKKREELLD
ncbi:hypothetical protein CTI12_AA384760 [Artemisia annua]|uniref:Uncharacterized protein n=1 Tax=Artemisia annua TaxID=35608 RepID=A0A2U1MF67_ARTAN|nr:hypothetical protein CTI12_AA384760 [Artemisia annua]